MSENPSTVAADTKPRPRVSIDAEAWQHIDRLLMELPYRTAAPVVQLLIQHGGVKGG